MAYLGPRCPSRDILRFNNSATCRKYYRYNKSQNIGFAINYVYVFATTTHDW